MLHEVEEKGFNGPIEEHGQNRVVENNPPVQNWLDGRLQLAARIAACIV